MKHLFCFLVIILVPAVGLGQTELLRSTDGSSVTMELLVPIFKNEPSFGISGFIALLSGSVAVSDMFSLKLEVPYVETKMESSSPFGSLSIKKGSLGNTYVGMGIGASTATVSGEIGVRLNTAGKDFFAPLSGFYGDFPRFERYLGELTTIRGGVNIHPRFENGLGVLVTLYPVLWLPSGGGETEVTSSYGLGAAYETDVVKAGLGVNGLWLMSEQGGFLAGNKDALHHFQAEVNARFGMIRPGVMVRLPLDKEMEATKFTLGVYISVLL